MKYLVKKWETLFCWEDMHNIAVLHMEFLLWHFQLYIKGKLHFDLTLPAIG
jgi:hypothetical protein